MPAKKTKSKSTAKKATSKSESFGSDLANGLKFPWINGVRLFNILWILVPLLGVFALYGYSKKIVQTIVSEKEKGLPKFGSFWENTKEGFMLFIKMIPTIIAAMILMASLL
jgi:hypothetical protein